MPLGVLNSLYYWSPIPAGAGESELIRLYRYRKTTPAGPFFLDQITDSFTYVAGEPWAFWIDLGSRIRPGYDLNPRTDVVAISRSYTPGAGAMVYSIVKFDLRPCSQCSTETAGVTVWPAP